MNKHDPETKIYKCNSCEKYYYLGEEDMRKEISDVLDNNVLNNNINCNLVFFTCNNSLNEPYLEFLLFFEKNNNNCNFDKFVITNTDFDELYQKMTHNDEYMDSIQIFNKMILENVCNKLNITSDDYNHNFEYIGFTLDDSNNNELNLYLFICVDENFKINNEKKTIIEKKLENNEKKEANKGFFSFLNSNDNENNEEEDKEIDDYYIFAIIDEIVFINKVDNIDIDNNVINIFKNEKFMFLKNEKNQIIDLPIACYNVNLTLDNDKKEIEFVNNDNSEPKTIDTPFGKRFVFSNPPEFDDIFSKYILFLGSAICIFNDNDVLLDNKHDDNLNKYKDQDVLIVTNSTNTYYIVKSIVHFSLS